jgi:integrase
MHANSTDWPTDKNGRPVRRLKVEQGIYRSVSGKLEVCFTDSDGKVRFELQQSPNISAAKKRRTAILAAKDSGAAVRANPRLKFGEVRKRWLSVDVSAKPAEQTRATLAYHASKLPWEHTRMDRIDSGEVARVLRELRTRGHADSTVAKVKATADAIFKFARRELRWAGTNPVADLPRSQRTATPEYLLHTEAAITATIAAAGPSWKAPLGFIADTGLRESEALAVQWAELHLDEDVPYVDVTHQLTRATKAQPAKRAVLKTEHSRGVVPLTREAVRLLKAHKLRSRHTGPTDYVFATVNGTPVSQRNLLRALDNAQRKATGEDGQPIYPRAAYIDPAGKLVVRRREDGKLVSRKDAGLPHVHGMRHSLATRIIEDGHRTEDATAILRHKDSEVTRRIYVHAIHSVEQHARLGDLLEKMSSGMARTDRDTAAQTHPDVAPKVAYLSDIRETA